MSTFLVNSWPKGCRNKTYQICEWSGMQNVPVCCWLIFAKTVLVFFKSFIEKIVQERGFRVICISWWKHLLKFEKIHDFSKSLVCLLILRLLLALLIIQRELYHWTCIFLYEIIILHLQMDLKNSFFKILRNRSFSKMSQILLPCKRELCSLLCHCICFAIN